MSNRAGKSHLVKALTAYCKEHGLSVYIVRAGETDLVIERDGTEREVQNARGLQLDMVVTDELTYR